MKKFISEFKEFALKNNAFDLAVGVVIGTAFTNIVQSMVKELITPIIDLVLPNNSLMSWVIVLRKEPLVELGIGPFLLTVLNFLTTAFFIFLVVKVINTVREKALKVLINDTKEVEEKVNKQEQLLSEILIELKEMKHKEK